MDQESPAPVTTLADLGCVGDHAALTFDDGPAPPWTSRLLDVLEDAATPATFFVLGSNIKGREDILVRMVDIGCTVEVHGWDHTSMTTMPSGRITADVDRTRSAIRDVTGTEPRYVRPPYGHADARVLAAIREVGMIPAFWTVDASDWTMPGAEAIERDIVAGLRAGAVAVLHDGGGDRSQTVAAVPPIIAQMRRLGLTAVSLPGPR